MRRVTALAACLALAAPAVAAARPDGPIRPYLEHQASSHVVWPALGTITDPFGFRWGRMHDGLDIGILRSLDVVAAASGLVTQTGYLAGYEGYGNVVVVQVDDGVEMLYAHLSRVDVRAGEWPRRLAGRAGRMHGLAPGRTCTSRCVARACRSTRCSCSASRTSSSNNQSSSAGAQCVRTAARRRGGPRRPGLDRGRS